MARPYNRASRLSNFDFGYQRRIADISDMINRIRRALSLHQDLSGLRVSCDHAFNEANRKVAEDMRKLVAKSHFDHTINDGIFIKRAIKIIADRSIEATTKAIVAVDNMPGRFDDHSLGRDHVREMIAAFFVAHAKSAVEPARRAGPAAEKAANDRLVQAQAEAQSLVTLNSVGLHKPDDDWNKRYLQFVPIAALLLAAVGVAKCVK